MSTESRTVDDLGIDHDSDLRATAPGRDQAGRFARDDRTILEMVDELTAGLVAVASALSALGATTTAAVVRGNVDRLRVLRRQVDVGRRPSSEQRPAEDQT